MSVIDSVFGVIVGAGQGLIFMRTIYHVLDTPSSKLNFRIFT